jgi:hypothetical protein
MWFHISLIALAGLLLVGCGSNNTSTTPTLTPSIATPIPVVQQTDVINYVTNTYNVLVAPGNNYVPNTQIRYVQKVQDQFELNIDGLQAFRRNGDIITWKGLVAPGLSTDYNLVLAASSENSLFTQGTVAINVFNPMPVELLGFPALVSPSVYSNLLLQYNVPQGQTIPGTTLVFDGQTDQGIRFSGTSQYPYYTTGSSLTYVGGLRQNVFVRYDLVLVGVSNGVLQVTGTGEMRYEPYRPPVQAVPFN